ncbi:hypothetical protein WPS_03730 [Vulcanimicrobium alpinum]|uniref:Restriction endonuclease domain-containing protein n=2 Tax=Vulcanimicrobium alpinum TaxID=3016050 RepID=A0AAN2C907_UNVUL|nr:hypothetical protein WPS_03730 [Vulcanimicrobium alpinum]
MAVEAIRRHVSVTEYNAMAQAGILGDDERVEGLDGDVIVAPPQGPPHVSVVARIADVLRSRLDARLAFPDVTFTVDELMGPDR